LNGDTIAHKALFMNRAWETSVKLEKTQGLGIDIISSLSAVLAAKATAESIATLKKVITKSSSSIVLVESTNPNETPSTLFMINAVRSRQQSNTGQVSGHYKQDKSIALNSHMILIQFPIRNLSTQPSSHELHELHELMVLLRAMFFH
jgi:hypothetical protein